MTEITLQVTIKCEEPINTSLQVTEVAENVLNGLIRQAENDGLAPLDNDNMAKSIKITNNNMNTIEYIFS